MIAACRAIGNCARYMPAGVLLCSGLAATLRPMPVSSSPDAYVHTASGLDRSPVSWHPSKAIELVDIDHLLGSGHSPHLHLAGNGMTTELLLPLYGLVVGLLVGLTGMGGGVLMTP